MGIIFHILLLAKPLYGGRKFEEVYENNKNHRFDLNAPCYSQLDPLAMDLLRKMLKINPAERITAAEVLKHPFFGNDPVEFEKHSPVTSIGMKSKTLAKAC
jgi:calcium-dependent protein kinase